MFLLPLCRPQGAGSCPLIQPLAEGTFCRPVSRLNSFLCSPSALRCPTALLLPLHCRAAPWACSQHCCTALQATFGQKALSITSFFTYVGLGLGFLGSNLALPFGLFVLLCQRDPENNVQVSARCGGVPAYSSSCMRLAIAKTLRTASRSVLS